MPVLVRRRHLRLAELALGVLHGGDELLVQLDDGAVALGVAFELV
jgi:hypothetical protein